MTLKSIILAGAVMLLAPGATTAWAQSAKPAAAAKVGNGAGTITALDTRAGTVTIKHGAIPAIGWPAMTMTFRASPPTLLKNLRTGQRVSFTAKSQGVTADVTAIRRQ